jgi:KaiC/GvpD/RAD55 family RecA-like ATPase
MKSSVAFNMLYQYAKETDKQCIYLTLEQKSDSLLFHMENLGIDTSALKNMIILDLGQIRDLTEKKVDEGIDWISATIRAISHLKRSFGCDLLAVDSLNALYALSDMTEPRKRVFQFTESLRAMGMSSVLVTEIQDDKTTVYGLESYLADGIIHLDAMREGRSVGLYIGISKMRATNHTRNYYPLLVQGGEFSIVTKE